MFLKAIKTNIIIVLLWSFWLWYANDNLGKQYYQYNMHTNLKKNFVEKTGHVIERNKYGMRPCTCRGHLGSKLNGMINNIYVIDTS